MGKEIYINTCGDCRLIFWAEKPSQHICPTCLLHRVPSGRGRKKRAKVKLTLAEVMRISKIYERVNHKYLHYGEIVTLLDRNVDRCICCGAIIPEGRHVCPQCEKAGGL